MNSSCASNVSFDLCSESLLITYSFATEGVGLLTVSVVGVLANALSITILTRRTMKNQISALLITLAVYDIVFLLCTVPVFTLQSVDAFISYVNLCIYPDGLGVICRGMHAACMVKHVMHKLDDNGCHMTNLDDNLTIDLLDPMQSLPTNFPFFILHQ